MKKQLTTAIFSSFVLAACSGMQPSTPGMGTMGDESSVVDHQMAGYEYQSANVLASEMADEIGDRVFFAFDSASLSGDAQASLKKMASFVLKNKGSIESVMVEGHCDERGTREYNLALGDRRAVAAKKFLVGMGVPSSMIRTISYGKERPADPRHNESAWMKNRRAVVVLK